MYIPKENITDEPADVISSKEYSDIQGENIDVNVKEEQENEEPPSNKKIVEDN